MSNSSDKNVLSRKTFKYDGLVRVYRRIIFEEVEFELVCNKS